MFIVRHLIILLYWYNLYIFLVSSEDDNTETESVAYITTIMSPKLQITSNEDEVQDLFISTSSDQTNIKTTFSQPGSSSFSNMSSSKTTNGTQMYSEGTSTTISTSKHKFSTNTINVTTTTLSPEEMYERKITQQRQLIERNWCKFLTLLYNELKSYEYQSSKSMYNVADLKDWNTRGKAQGLRINKQNVKNFFELSDIKHLLDGNEGVNTWNVSLMSKKMFADLNNVIDLTIGMKILVHCNGNKLVISRPILNLADVTDEMLDKKCRHEDSNETKIIELFASDTIYISRNIELIGRKVILVIMAPNWIIPFAGSPTVIDLSGSSPQKMDPPKAENGAVNRHGKNGKPGAPGDHSGHFIGLGEVFLDEQFLVIIANGGDGQSGQNGGDGGPGAHGRDADLEKRIWNCTQNSVGSWHQCNGEKGFAGADGGQGGAGGLPGKEGIVNIISSNNTAISVQIITNAGSSGADGKGGKGGKGGKHGLDKECKTFIWDFEHKNLPLKPPAEDGKDGKGINREGVETNTNFPLDLKEYSGKFINDYKSYLEDCLVNNYTRARNLNFLLRLFKNDDLTFSHYKLTDHIDQFLSIEKHFYHLYNQMSLLPLYEEIQKQIDRGSSKTNDEETIKVFNHLYTSTQSKVCMYHNSASGKFISNVNSFLSMFMQNAKLLREFQEEETISNANKEYKAGIDKKIKESESLIAEQILPKLRKFAKKISDSVDELLQQIPEMKRQLQRKKDEINQAIKDLKKCFILNIISAVLEVAAVVANFVPGVGQAIGGALELTNMAVKAGASSFDHDVSEFGGFRTDLAQRSENVMKLVSNVDIPEIKKYAMKMEGVAEDVRKVIENGANAVINLCVKNQRCKSFLDSKPSAKLEEIYNKIKEAGKKIYKKVEKGFNTVMKAFKKVKNTIGPVVEAVGNGVSKVLDTKNKLDAAENALKEVDNQIKGLDTFKNNIKKVLIPVVQNLTNDLNNLIDDLTNKSASALEVKRLSLKEHMNDVKKVLLQFTANFSVEGEVRDAMDGIIGAIDPLIDIFKQIDSYKDQKKMADFLTKINSAKFKGIQVSDPEVANGLVRLKVNMQSNILFLDYIQSMNQLKQFVFPLGKYFFEKITVPSFLEKSIVSNQADFLFSAITEVETYKKNLIRSEVFVTKYDTLKHRKMFYSGFIYSKPFYVWRSRVDGETISRLLSGEEVALTATPDHHFENAIKFNYIHLRFKVMLYQNKLDKILNNFMAVMTHMGNSFYKCANKTYIIITESQQFRFTFEKYNNKPIDSNLVFEKISHGDFLLSPFATWKFKLITLNETNFKLLKEFQRYADLELVGAAEYYEDDKELCPDDLTDMYDLLNITQETNTGCLNNCHNCSYIINQ